MPVIRDLRTSSALGCRSALAVLAAALFFAAFSAAQTAPASASAPAPSDQSQSASSNGATLSPSAHPDATSVGIPTAAQIEAAGAHNESDEPDPSAGSPAPKLAAATALWLGFAHLPDYLIYASLFGGALTLLIVQFRALPLPRVFVGREWAERLHRRGAGVPYGIALAAAALWIYPQTEWMAAIIH